MGTAAGCHSIASNEYVDHRRANRWADYIHIFLA
jgi:hypothetical protein